MPNDFGPLGDIRPSARPVQAGNPQPVSGMFGEGVAAALRNLGAAQFDREMSEEQIANAEQNLERAHQARQNRLLRANTRASVIRETTALTQDVEQIRRAMPADGAGFTDTVYGTVNERLEALRESIPEELQPEFESRFAQIESSFTTQAFMEELEAGDTAYVGQVEETLQTGISAIQEQMQIGTASPELFEQWRQDMTDLIATSPLDQATTEGLLDSAIDSIDLLEYTNDVRGRLENPTRDFGALPGREDGRDVHATGLPGPARGLLNAWGGMDARPSPNVQVNVAPHTGRPDERLLNILSNVGEQVFGPGTQINIASGHEGRSTGTRRHPAGTAADFTITLPNGETLPYMDPRGDNVVGEFLRSAAAAGVRGMGYGADYMGNAFHMDIFPPEQYRGGEGHLWAELGEVPGLMEALQDGPSDAPVEGYGELENGETFTSFDAHPGDQRAGRYQLTPEAWEEARSALNLPNFTPENQDRAAWWIAGQEYRDLTDRNLQADLASSDPVLIEQARQSLLEIQEREGSALLFQDLEEMSAEEFYRQVSFSRPTLPSTVFDDSFASIPFEDRLTIFGEQSDEVNQRIIAAQAEASERRSSMLEQLSANISLGNAGMADIQRVNKDYNLLPTEMEDLVTALERSQGERRSLASFASSLQSSNMFFDRSQAGERRLADRYAAERYASGMQERDVDMFQNRVMRDVDRLNYVPQPVRDTLGRMMRSDNPEDVDFAMAGMLALYSDRPHLFEQDFSDEETAIARYMSTVGRFLPREESMAVVNQLRNPANAEILRQADTVYSQSLRDNYEWFQPSTIASQIDRGWGETGVSTPQQGVALQREFSELFRQGLYGGMPPRDARTYAEEALQNRWGETTVGSEDGYVMRRPPENYHAPSLDGTFDWIDETVRQDLGLDEITSYRLYSDHITESRIQAGEAPTYGIVVEDEIGIFVPHMTDGRPTHIRFDQQGEVVDERIQQVLGERATLQTNRQFSNGVQDLMAGLRNEVDMTSEEQRDLITDLTYMAMQLRQSGEEGRQALSRIVTTSGLTSLDPITSRIFLGNNTDFDQ